MTHFRTTFFKTGKASLNGLLCAASFFYFFGTLYYQVDGWQNQSINSKKKRLD